MLSNRKEFEEIILKGVNLASHPIKMKLGSFTSLENYIPGHDHKIKRKRGVDPFVSEGRVITAPAVCGECSIYSPQVMEDLILVPSGGDYTTWNATYTNPRATSGYFTFNGGNLECWVNTRSGAHQFDSYNDDSVAVFKQIWTPDGTPVSTVETDDPKPGESDVGTELWRNYFQTLPAGQIYGGGCVFDEPGFATKGPTGNPVGIVVYPERDSGTGVGITFNEQTGGINANTVSCAASWGGDTGVFFMAGYTTASAINKATIDRWDNFQSGAPPLATARGSSIKVYTDGGYARITAYQPGDVNSWATAWSNLSPTGLTPTLLQLDPTTDAILNSFSMAIPTYTGVQYSGMCVVADRWAFQVIDTNINTAFHLYMKDLLLNTAWVLFSDVTKSLSTSGAVASQSLLYTVGPDNTIYLLWFDRQNEGNEGHFWTPIPCG